MGTMYNEETDGVGGDTQPKEANASVDVAINVDTIQSDLLVAQRDIVKSSDFRAALENVQSHLDEIPAEPLPLGYIAQASDKNQMEEAIVREHSLDSKKHTTTNTWVSSLRFRDSPYLLSPTLAFMGTSFASIYLEDAGVLEMLGVSQQTYLTVGLGGALAAMLWLMMFAILSGLPNQKPILTLRNKVFSRKAYKREVNRLLGEAESTRERYERIVAIRKTKLEAVQKAITPAVNDFALANPGQSLKIVTKDDKMTLDVVRAEGYSYLDSVAAQVIAGTAQIRR